MSNLVRLSPCSRLMLLLVAFHNKPSANCAYPCDHQGRFARFSCQVFSNNRWNILDVICSVPIQVFLFKFITRC